MIKMKLAAIAVVISAMAICSFSIKPKADNTLSKAEKREGWKLLFDGKSLEGWRPYQNKETNSWMVEKGVFHCKGSTTDKSDKQADILIKNEFENFELSIDWKISPKGNSGILYMVTEEYPAAYQSGPEYQIIDDINFPQKLEDWQKTGANYAMDAAPLASPHPAGEWNTTQIVVNKGQVQHWLNGKKILDFEMWNSEWKKKKMEGKWKDAPGYGLAKRGHIALQDHGSEAWFKNIKIKEL